MHSFIKINFLKLKLIRTGHIPSTLSFWGLGSPCHAKTINLIVFVQYFRFTDHQHPCKDDVLGTGWQEKSLCCCKLQGSRQPGGPGPVNCPCSCLSPDSSLSKHLPGLRPTVYKGSHECEQLLHLHVHHGKGQI